MGFLYAWYHNYIPPCHQAAWAISNATSGGSPQQARSMCRFTIYIYTICCMNISLHIMCLSLHIMFFFLQYIYIYNLIILISAQWVSSIHRSEQIVGLMIRIYPKLHQHQRQKMGGDFLEDEASNSLGVVVWFKECALVIFYATVGIGDSSREGGSWSSILHSKISHIPGQTSP